MTKIKNAAPIIFLTILFGFIFFYRLDYNTLGSWDEAWYGSIAREMLRTGDYFKMVWNGKPYYDHPPMGFWLMAISYRLFGISEFSTRLPSALLGLLAIFVMYKTGLKLSGKKIVGFVSALVMGTSVWYVIRVRSGNLDSIFVFFYILTVYASLKADKDFRWFPIVSISFAGLLLSKTLVGSSVVLLILFSNLRNFLQIKENWKYLILGLICFMALILPWYYIQNKAYPDFYEHHFINIGTRNKTLSSYFHPTFAQPLFYLHMGVRKWYYVWLGSVAFLLVTFKFLKKNIFFLLLWNIIILYPFLTSAQTELWHLIPVYLPLSFIIALGVYKLSDLISHISKQIIESHYKKIKNIEFERIFNPLYLALFLCFAFLQIKVFYSEVFPANKWIPDDVAISKAAAKYKKPIFLDDDYLPIAVFYSGQNVQPLAYLPDDNKKTLAKFIQSDEHNYVVITRNWVVDDLKSKKIPYQLLEKNNSFSILTKQ